MSIIIASNRSIDVKATSKGDDSLDIVVKLIPTEVVTLYLTALSFDNVENSRLAGPALLTIGTLLTPLVLFFVGRRSNQSVPLAQYVVRTLAFVAWAFAIGNPLAPMDPIEPWIPRFAILVIPLLGSFLFPR